MLTASFDILERHREVSQIDLYHLEMQEFALRLKNSDLTNDLERILQINVRNLARILLKVVAK